jgi:hypothetical protein
MAWDVFYKNRWRALTIGTVVALSGCGKDDDIKTVTQDMKMCRDGGGRPSLSSDLYGRGLHVICWPKETFN